MSQEENKQVVRAAFEPLDAVMEKHEEIYAPDWVGHFSGMPPLDLDGHKQYSDAMTGAFPDLERTIDDLLADGDKVIARWSATGTNTGPFNGMPPSGKFARSSGITIFRIADGRIAEEWSESDMLGLLTQIGVIPGGPEG
jgi:steroid delta-isomerase-like uncharacterized protein